jgi:hypothetical protein
MQQILNAYLGAIHSQLIPKQLQPEFLAHVVITVCADHGGNNTKPAAARINYTQTRSSALVTHLALAASTRMQLSLSNKALTAMHSTFG